MSPAQIEQLALEAGISITTVGMVIDGEYGGLHIRKLVRFAEVVRAAALEEAASECDPQIDGCITTHRSAARCAAVIRALAQQAGGEQGGEKPC